MSFWFNILALAILFSARPCRGQNAEATYTIGAEAQTIDIDELRYVIEPVNIPVDISRISQIETWSLTKNQRLF